MTTTTQENESLNQEISTQGLARPKRTMANMTVRLVTGLVLLPVILLVTFAGGWLFMAFVALMVLIGTLEYYYLEQRWSGRGSNTWLGMPFAVLVLVGFYGQVAPLAYGAVVGVMVLALLIERYHRQVAWDECIRRMTSTSFGAVYLAVPAGMIVLVRGIEPTGLLWLYVILFATWGTDVFAYLVGSRWGRTPLAPRLSPKKTVEGALGGIFGGVFFPALILVQMQALDAPVLFVLVCAPLVAIAGDLFESWLKRTGDVKDSGVYGFNLIPGHGGILDRVDALLWVAVLFYVYLSLMGLVGF